MSERRDWTVYDRPELRAGFGTTSASGCEVMLALDGMHCAACAGRATKQLAGQASDIHINVAAKTARFRFDPKHTRLSTLLAALDGAGLDPRILASENSAEREARARRIAFARIGVATICAMQVMMLAWPTYFVDDLDAGMSALLRWSQLVLSVPGVLWAGWPFFANAARAIRSRQLDMDVPVALALAAAFVASAMRVLLGSGELYFDTATMFVWFLTLGRYLEGRSRARASERLRLLAGRRALTAQRRIGDQIETIAIGELALGDVAVVAPGETLPADGSLLETAAELDEALLSGESRPQLRQPGQTVLAGTLNLGSAPLLLTVERLGAATVLAQITQLLDRAQTGKPKLQQLADRIAGHFIATVLVLAAIGAALAIDRGASGDAAFGIALAVLVASCPCALSLAVPVALAAATSRLARSGVLVANASALQPLAAIDRVLFDKTGTLTRNQMALSRVLPLAGGDPGELTAIAAALERGSRHPIASAFAEILSPVQATQLKQVAGAGIRGLVDGQDWWLGALDSLPQPVALPTDLPPDLAVDLAVDAGDTVIVLSREQQPQALFVISTRLRGEANAVASELQRRGLKLELLSGDADDAVRTVAARVGIADHRARQTPAAKLARLQALQADGHRVLAVGDGLNDAPLLAAADVSACMPQGAALTQARADLLLLGDSLSLLPLALDVARATQARIRENLCWALGYNLLVLPLAMTGNLAPWLAAAGMSASSLLVVANALRLERLPSPSPSLPSPR